MVNCGTANDHTIWTSPHELKVKLLVIQLCRTLCDPMDCSPSGSSAHGVFQGRMLELVAIFYSRGSSRPRDQSWISGIAGSFFTIWATWCWIIIVCILKRKKKKKDWIQADINRLYEQVAQVAMAATFASFPPLSGSTPTASCWVPYN